MPRILDEPVVESPLWLEVAGYPAYLNGKIRSGAWPVFKKLVELDCALNPRPDIFTASVHLIAARVGMESDAVTRIVKALRKEQLLRYYLPEDEGEEAMFRFITPFRPPMDVEEARRRMSEMPVQKAARLRYIDEPAASDPAADSIVQRVVDAYLNCFGVKINSFVLDELTLLAGRFSFDQIQNAFARAVQLKQPSLRWIVHELVARKKASERNSLG